MKNELNGSAALLIRGLQGVMKETVEESIKPLKDSIDRLDQKVDKNTEALTDLIGELEGRFVNGQAVQ